jgi:hypothetical protein
LPAEVKRFDSAFGVFEANVHDQASIDQPPN